MAAALAEVINLALTRGSLVNSSVLPKLPTHSDPVGAECEEAIPRETGLSLSLAFVAIFALDRRAKRALRSAVRLPARRVATAATASERRRKGEAEGARVTPHARHPHHRSRMRTLRVGGGTPPEWGAGGEACRQLGAIPWWGESAG